MERERSHIGRPGAGRGLLGTALAVGALLTLSCGDSNTTPGIVQIDVTWLGSPTIFSCGGFTDGAGRAWTDPAFDDGAWTAVTLPDEDSFYVEQGGEDADRYYRGTFTLDRTDGQVGFRITSDDGAEVYVNGTLVGKFGLEDDICHAASCVNLPDCGINVNVPPQVIPAALLHTGTNVLAVHVSNALQNSVFDFGLYVEP